MSRLAIICAADAPICPHPQCGNRLDSYGGRVGLSETRFRICSAKTRRGGNGERHRCGQKALIFGKSGDECYVFRISDEEYETMQAGDRSAVEIMSDLGMLTATVIELDRAA